MMVRKSRECSGCLLASFAMLAAMHGCQTMGYDTSGRAILEASQSARGAVHATTAPNKASLRSSSAVSVTDYENQSTDSRRAGEPAPGSRRMTLASYRDGAADVRQAAAYRRGEPNNDSPPDTGTSLSMSYVAMADKQPADGDKSAAANKSNHSAESLAEINNKLNNPGADLAQLNFKLTWTQYQGSLGGDLAGSTRQGLKSLRAGDLFRAARGLLRGSKGEGPSSQNSLTLLFQPVFPFSLSNGAHIIARPTIPIVWMPFYNGSTGGFDEDFGLGDSVLNVFYSRTDKKKGIMWGLGGVAGFPTATDDWLGKDQFQLGPAGFVGKFGKWGSTGVFPQHLWNIGGAGGYTAETQVQVWYWFNVGKGYQVGGAPLIVYDWANDDSDDALTLPVNLGVAKTVLMGKLPVKLKLEGIYYAQQPDDFGPHWGLQFTITPVIKNPFKKKHGA